MQRGLGRGHGNGLNCVVAHLDFPGRATFSCASEVLLVNNASLYQHKHVPILSATTYGTRSLFNFHSIPLQTSPICCLAVQSTVKAFRWYVCGGCARARTRRTKSFDTSSFQFPRTMPKLHTSIPGQSRVSRLDIGANGTFCNSHGLMRGTWPQATGRHAHRVILDRCLRKGEWNVSPHYLI